MNLIAYCIHARLVLHVDKGENIISRKELLMVLGRNYHIPARLKDKVIDELKEYKVIIGSGKGYYIINKRIKPLVS